MRLSFTLIIWACSFSMLTAQQDFSLAGTLIDHSRLRGGTPSINPDWAPFYHGVASGDPLADRVIIWTRVTPDSVNTNPIEVNWSVATDNAMSNIVVNGMVTADASTDYTVKIDVTGLAAGQTYYYLFNAMGKNSLIGKTKTVPEGAVSHLRFGVVSCNNFQAGLFNAFHRLADRNDLDAIIHLGDYIYEYADGEYGNQDIIAQRPLDPNNELISLADYRTRYSTYRLDTNLIRAHQQHPFISIWDDHESANDSWTGGAENHTDSTEGNWNDRLAMAKQAYFEWLPIRDQADNRVYRTISYGDLADLILLDTRVEGREEQIFDISNPALYDTNRTLLGTAQYDWFLDQLNNSTAKWKVIGQQVIFSKLNVGWFSLQDSTLTFDELESLFLDIWDGYPAERQKILDYITDQNLDNTVILTGDFHTTLAFDVTAEPVDLQFLDPGVGYDVPFYNATSTYDPMSGQGSVAVEFVTPSISSANFDENVGILPALFVQAQINTPINLDPPINSLGNPNPHMKYADLIQHGYCILDLKPDSVQGDYFFSEILQPSNSEAFGKGWFTLDGENHLQLAASESEPKATQDIPAPQNPPLLLDRLEETMEPVEFAILSMYPNPFHTQTQIHYVLQSTKEVRISLLDQLGNVVKVLLTQKLPQGVYTLKIDADALPAGTYYIRMEAAQQIETRKVVLSR